MDSFSVSTVYNTPESKKKLINKIKQKIISGHVNIFLRK